MKIKEIIHENTIAFSKLSPIDKVILDAIHSLQEKVEMLMTNLEMTKDDVSSNTTYRETGKYVTPAGRFKTYSAAARGNNITSYMVKKLIKDENNLEYYIDLDNPTAIQI